MILRLSGADFSANNIGRVSIIKEITSDTKSILSNYSRVLSENQKYAVQEFIDALKENGLWSKISSLYIPALAGLLSETMYNIKTNTVDAIPSSNYILNGYALRVSETDRGTNIGNPVTVKTTASYMNLHICAYLDNVSAGTLTTIYDGSNVLEGLQNPSSPVTFKRITNNADATPSTLTSYPANGFVCMSTGTSTSFVAFDGATATFPTLPTEDKTINNIDTYVLTNYAKKTPAGENGLKIFGIGSYLTREETLMYNTLCDALIASICN